MKLTLTAFVLLCFASAGHAYASRSYGPAASSEVLQDHSTIAPPATLRELVALSDCIVSVRMDEGRERSYDIPRSRGPNVRTEYRPEVLEIFKSDTHRCGGGDFRVLHPTVVSGVKVGDKLIRVPGKRPPSREEEYVVFLVWSDVYQAYELLFGSASLYRLDQSTVRVDDDHPLSRAWSGRTVTELISTLKGRR